MRRLSAGLATLSLLTTLALVFAVPASGASRGTIEGKVMNESTHEPQPGVELTLTTGTDAGDGEVVEKVTSDARGRYRFTGLATGADRFYALDGRFEGGLFAGRPITLPSDTTKIPVIDSTMRVWNTTSDPAVVAVRRDDMFVVTNDEGVAVIESVTVVNTSEEAYIGRGAEMVGKEASGASFAFALPSGAEAINIFDSSLDIPEIIPVDQGFAATVAFPPGETRTTFSFTLPGTGGSFDLSRPALYPTLELSIYAAAPLEIRSNRLVAKDNVTLEGKTYERWSADEPIDAGDPLQALAVAGGSVPIWPFIGAGAALVVLVGGLAVLVRKRGPRATAAQERARRLEKVAVLDLAYEAGEIDQRKWAEERASLVGKLRASDQ